MKKIHYAKPSITDLEIKYVTNAIKHGWAEHCYEYINRFENSFKQYLNVNFAIATSSCTGALHLALAALDIKTSDEVIIADINWIASVSPIIYLGAKPVFVDILSDSWCIDPKKIKAAITSKTKAIIVVHLYGNLAEMDEILAIAKKHNLYVIEDSAEALGSEYKAQKAGSIAHFGVFSFHGSKTVCTGEGGMLVTNDEKLFKKAQILADHGRNQKNKKMFWPEKIGYKYRMSNLQAAMGLAQIERADELVDRKREIFYKYKEYLSDVKEISLNPELSYTKNSFWMTTVIFDKSLNIDREKLIEYFKQNNIDVRAFFYPLSALPMFEKKEENVVSYNIYYRGINLPCYYDMTDEEIRKVSGLLKQFLNKNKIERGG